MKNRGRDALPKKEDLPAEIKYQPARESMHGTVAKAHQNPKPKINKILNRKPLNYARI